MSSQNNSMHELQLPDSSVVGVGFDLEPGEVTGPMTCCSGTAGTFGTSQCKAEAFPRLWRGHHFHTEVLKTYTKCIFSMRLEFTLVFVVYILCTPGVTDTWNGFPHQSVVPS